MSISALLLICWYIIHLWLIYVLTECISGFHAIFILPPIYFFFVFTFPGEPYRIFLPWLPCHFYRLVIEQQHYLYFHLLPCPVHPTIFPFCFFPGFLAIFSLSSNNLFSFHLYLHWCTLPDFPSVSSLPSFPVLSCYQTTTTGHPIVMEVFPSISFLVSLPFSSCRHIFILL